ncbi:hypothetical protein GEMRC1_010179 [Eukaryota sp. GEM-RC1]
MIPPKPPTINPSSSCESCCQNESFHFCRNCGISFCKECVEQVHSHRVFAKHDVVPIEDAILEVYHPCKQHLHGGCPEMRYFCNVCAEPACIDCFNLGTHRDHSDKIVYLKQRADEYSEAVEELMTALHESHQSIPITSSFESIKDQQVNLLDLINKKCVYMMEEAKENKRQCVQRIQEQKFSILEEIDVSGLISLLKQLDNYFTTVKNQFHQSINSIAQLSDSKTSTVFGKIQLFPDSTVLQGCSTDLTDKFRMKSDSAKLIFRASRDGFTSSAFHSNCDNISNVIVLLKTSNGNIAGGFRSAAFDSSGSQKNSPGAFLFRVKVGDNENFEKFTVISGQSQSSINCHSSYGPYFGGNPDLYLVNNCNTSNSSCNPGSTFNGTYSELLGENSFTVEDYEVYSIEPVSLSSSDLIDSSVLQSDCPDISSLMISTTETPRLLFRGSRDGFSGSQFHNHCDGQGNVF